MQKIKINTHTALYLGVGVHMDVKNWSVYIAFLKHIVPDVCVPAWLRLSNWVKHVTEHEACRGHRQTNNLGGTDTWERERLYKEDEKSLS